MSEMFRRLLPGEEMPCEGCGEPATRQSEEFADRMATEHDIDATGAVCGKCYQTLVRSAVSRRLVAAIREGG